MNNKKTLVIGASTKPERYSFKAINSLKQNHHEVVALGMRSGEVSGVNIETEMKAFSDIHTVTLYVSAKHQPAYYDYITNTLKPKRVIFNPGTENSELMDILEGQNIEVSVACTLVLLSIGEY